MPGKTKTELTAELAAANALIDEYVALLTAIHTAAGAAPIAAPGEPVWREGQRARDMLNTIRMATKTPESPHYWASTVYGIAAEPLTYKPYEPAAPADEAAA